VPPTVEQLRADLLGKRLPGGSFHLERHESSIADHAVLATDGGDSAHPIWFVIASLRGMGITVDELCGLCRQEDGDTLLFGGVEVWQELPLAVGGEYETEAEITAVDRRTTRSGYDLDAVTVRVRLCGESEVHGEVTSVYLFKRGAA
jgi:hypothetical protein